MIRSELIDQLARNNRGLHARDAQRIVEIFFDEIVRRLAADGRVELRGFGTFSTRTHRARDGRNPRTGDFVAVAAKRVPHFKPSRGTWPRRRPDGLRLLRNPDEPT